MPVVATELGGAVAVDEALVDSAVPVGDGTALLVRALKVLAAGFGDNDDDEGGAGGVAGAAA